MFLMSYQTLEQQYSQHILLVLQDKQKVTTLPCVSMPNPETDIIVEKYASKIGYWGILKQKAPRSSQESIVDSIQVSS